MQIKIFNIPINDTGYFTEELNKFLRSNKVLDVSQQFVQNEGVSCWSFCVRYLETKVNEQNVKRDYKQELDEDMKKILGDNPERGAERKKQMEIMSAYFGKNCPNEAKLFQEFIEFGEQMSKLGKK